MTNTATLPTVTLNSTFKLGRKSYTMQDGIQQAVACYDQLYLLQEDMLKNYRELGNILLQIEALFLGNKKACRVCFAFVVTLMEFQSIRVFRDLIYQSYWRCECSMHRSQMRNRRASVACDK